MERLPYSSNYILRENFRFPQFELKKIQQSLGDCRDIYLNESKKNVPKETKFFSNYDCRHLENKFSKYFIVGNCSELSSVVFIYLLKQKEPNLYVEMLSIEGINGNHLFIMIGGKGNLENPGKEAVIVDPWLRQVYPAPLWEDLLKNCVSTTTTEGVPRLENFNPNIQHIQAITQSVKLSISNKFFSHQSNMTEVKNLLNEFHSIHEISQKIGVAQKILQIISEKNHFLTRESSTLFTQLKYFLKIYS
jgi:hypothetical protein